ncbi:MAG TPA: nuclear transport factor 2 family protein [Pyrinomonadaceae bacterium]|nr:nuclear transport factor 2 family protein [Pyrinomonadaceae bacterium]
MDSRDEDRQAAPDYQAEHELRRANDEWANALAQRDKAALECIMADDFTFAYPFEGDDKGQFINDVVAGVVRVESLEPRDTTVRVFGGTGLVFGSETANWHYGDRDLSGHYRFVRVYTKRQGLWQIVSLHLCSPTHR